MGLAVAIARKNIGVLVGGLFARFDERDCGLEGGLMLDRQKIETILTRRFTGATRGQVAAVANAIMGLGDEWEEIIGNADDLHGGDMQVPRDQELRLFRRREA